MRENLIKFQVSKCCISDINWVRKVSCLSITRT